MRSPAPPLPFSHSEITVTHHSSCTLTPSNRNLRSFDLVRTQDSQRVLHLPFYIRTYILGCAVIIIRPWNSVNRFEAGSLFAKLHSLLNGRFKRKQDRPESSSERSCLFSDAVFIIQNRSTLACNRSFVPREGASSSPGRTPVTCWFQFVPP